MVLQVGVVTFRADFDSANLASVKVSPDSKVWTPCLWLNLSLPRPGHPCLSPAAPVPRMPYAANFIATPQEYELYTLHDCHGTVHETNHKSWFYFSVVGHKAGDYFIFNVMNMNKQAKLYQNDFRPLFRTFSSMHDWERIRCAVLPPETSCRHGIPLDLCRDFRLFVTCMARAGSRALTKMAMGTSI